MWSKVLCLGRSFHHKVSPHWPMLLPWLMFGCHDGVIPSVTTCFHWKCHSCKSDWLRMMYWNCECKIQVLCPIVFDMKHSWRTKWTGFTEAKQNLCKMAVGFAEDLKFKFHKNCVLFMHEKKTPNSVTYYILLAENQIVKMMMVYS